MSTEPPAERLALYESMVDRQIRKAAARGEFDGLPGAGRPLASRDTAYDPDWWARGFVNRERLRDRANEVRRLIRSELPRLRAEPDSEAARQRAAELNRVVELLNAQLPSADRIEPIDL